MINVDMMNKPENIYTDGGETIIDIKELPDYDGAQYDFLDDRSFKKYMSDVEKAVRTSFEYRQLIRYLRYTEGMSKCSFLDNVEATDGSKVRIEIHHSPLTLYDICLAVFKKRQNNKEPIDVNSVAEEVMWLHYIGWVGLVPLSESVHAMVHNQYIFVPTDIVRGNWRQFVTAYYNYIAPETHDAIDAADRATKEYNGSQMDIFNNHQIYVNVNGSLMQPKRKSITSTVRNRVNEIKSGGKVMCTIVK